MDHPHLPPPCGPLHPLRTTPPQPQGTLGRPITPPIHLCLLQEAREESRGYPPSLRGSGECAPGKVGRGGTPTYMRSLAPCTTVVHPRRLPHRRLLPPGPLPYVGALTSVLASLALRYAMSARNPHRLK